MTPAQIEVVAVLVFRIGLVVALIVAVLFGLGKCESMVEAPLKAELAASRGNQAAGKAAVDAQNKGVDAMVTDSKDRKAKSEAAVKTAGEQNYQRAAEIRAAAPDGESDYDRAVNRINRELGLK